VPDPLSKATWTAVPAGAWGPASGALAREGDVHVLSASLDQAGRRLQALAGLLSPDETRRAARYHFARDRDRFITARGLLRSILAPYLGVPPEGIEFRYGPQGKPRVVSQITSADLRFNVSHSNALALYAICRGRDLGVDVERVKPLSDADHIAERFFSAREGATLRALPEGERQRAFFACWTRKEAYIKATGDGLSRPLDEFDVSLGPGCPARLERVAGAPEEAARWSLAALEPAEGYEAALAIEGPLGRLSCWEWVPADVAPSAGPWAHAIQVHELEAR
jgi:4'-phosphopantetheinyl transferase